MGKNLLRSPGGECCITEADDDAGDQGAPGDIAMEHDANFHMIALWNNIQKTMEKHHF